MAAKTNRQFVVVAYVTGAVDGSGAISFVDDDGQAVVVGATERVIIDTYSMTCGATGGTLTLGTGALSKTMVAAANGGKGEHLPNGMMSPVGGLVVFVGPAGSRCEVSGRVVRG